MPGAVTGHLIIALVGLGKSPLSESSFDPKPQVSLVVVSSSQSTSTTREYYYLAMKYYSSSIAVICDPS